MRSHKDVFNEMVADITGENGPAKVLSILIMVQDRDWFMHHLEDSTPEVRLAIADVCRNIFFGLVYPSLPEHLFGMGLMIEEPGQTGSHVLYCRYGSVDPLFRGMWKKE